MTKKSITQDLYKSNQRKNFESLLLSYGLLYGLVYKFTKFLSFRFASISFGKNENEKIVMTALRLADKNIEMEMPSSSN